MRRFHEMLRYRFEQRLGHKAISMRVGAAPSTVRETLRGAASVRLVWPLGEDVDDAGLEAAFRPRRRRAIVDRQIRPKDPRHPCFFLDKPLAQDPSRALKKCPAWL